MLTEGFKQALTEALLEMPDADKHSLFKTMEAADLVSFAAVHRVPL